MTLIRRDRYGLYARVGGYVFRPVHSKNSYAYVTRTKSIGGTELQVGMKVHTRHIASTPLGNIGDELWASHGEYLNNSSEDCWHPI